MMIVHRAELSTVVVSESAQPKYFELPQVIPVSDVTGAGDAFSAAFLAGWIKGDTVANSVNSAHLLASEIVANRGFEFS